MTSTCTLSCRPALVGVNVSVINPWCLAVWNLGTRTDRPRLLHVIREGPVYVEVRM